MKFRIIEKNGILVVQRKTLFWWIDMESFNVEERHLAENLIEMQYMLNKKYIDM